jgi:hypothetical protein
MTSTLKSGTRLVPNLKDPFASRLPSRSSNANTCTGAAADAADADNSDAGMSAVPPATGWAGL